MRKLIVLLVSIAFMYGLAGAEPYDFIIKKPVDKEHQNSIVRKPIITENQPFIDRHHVNFEPETKTQIYRIYADGGVVRDFHYMNRVIRKMKSQGIYSSCKLLADANIAYKNATGVTTLYDISGNNNDITQATGANQPIWTAGVQNGRGGLAFNSSVPTHMAAPSDYASLKITGAISVFMLTKPTDGQPAAQNRLIRKLGGGGEQSWAFDYDNTNFYVYIYDSLDVLCVWQAAHGWADGQMASSRLLNFVFDPGVSIKVYDNGTEKSGSFNTGTIRSSIKDSIEPLGIGHTSPYYNGATSGLIIFNIALSTAQRQVVESLINTYYAIY